MFQALVGDSATRMSAAEREQQSSNGVVTSNNKDIIGE